MGRKKKNGLYILNRSEKGNPMVNEDLIRILFVEDLPSDAELAEWELRNEGLHFTSIRVETKEEFLKALEEFRPDLIISDYSMPQFDGLKALRLSLKHDPDIPFIILTGSTNEETAVDCMKVGATDYVIKESIRRLPFAVLEALEQKKTRLAREEAEREKKESQEELEAIYQNSPLIMILVDEKGRVQKVNDFATRFVGQSSEEMICRQGGEALRCLHAFDDPKGCGFGPFCLQCWVHRIVRDTFETGVGHHHEEVSLPVSIKNKKKTLTFLLFTTRLTIRKQPMVLVTILDITQRKEAEEALKEKSVFLSTLVDAIPAPVFYKDAEGRYLDVNKSFEEFFGQTRQDLVGKSVFDISPRELAAIYQAKDLELLQHPGVQVYETQVKDARGLVHDVVFHKAVFKNADGQVSGLIGVILDITEHRRAEEALCQSEEKYRNIFNNAVEGIFQATPAGRFLTANPALARIYGYGSPEELIETVTDIAEQIYVDPEQRREYSRILDEKGEVKDYELHLKRKDGTTFWISNNARAVYDSMGKILFYEGLSEDITRRKEAEIKLNESLESLRKAIGTTIQVMVAAVETRDPYTAGHQKRTTDLARAIASEMGLPQDRIEGIRLAGAIHDIGKISVPAEILSKPIRLSEIEFSLIKEHSKYGYEILKEVESPWPLADMVLQHHERMDGSGYPQGLKGEDILLEARIIAVADVVEAMASFRPYRPALGIEAALEEIEKNAGVMYDKEVVVSCLRLFREKGFGFE